MTKIVVYKITYNDGEVRTMVFKSVEDSIEFSTVHKDSIKQIECVRNDFIDNKSSFL